MPFFFKKLPEQEGIQRWDILKFLIAQESLIRIAKLNYDFVKRMKAMQQDFKISFKTF